MGAPIERLPAFVALVGSHACVDLLVSREVGPAANGLPTVITSVALLLCCTTLLWCWIAPGLPGCPPTLGILFFL